MREDPGVGDRPGEAVRVFSRVGVRSSSASPRAGPSKGSPWAGFRMGDGRALNGPGRVFGLVWGLKAARILPCWTLAQVRLLLRRAQ